LPTYNTHINKLIMQLSQNYAQTSKIVYNIHRTRGSGGSMNWGPPSSPIGVTQQLKQNTDITLFLQ